MPVSTLKVCVLKGKCSYQKVYVIAKRSYAGKPPLPVLVCKFPDRCNQQRFLSSQRARRLAEKHGASSVLHGNVKKAVFLPQKIF